MELLNENRQRELIAQPESGMGYQNVAIELRNGEARYGTVFNAEFLLYSGESPHLLEKISDPFARSRLLEQNQLGFGEEISSLRVLPTEADVSTRVQESSPATQSSSGASNAPEEELQQEEQFKRFSAYANDRRVTANGALVPGTYATTEADAKHVQTGSDAVKRYALPNPAPAVHVFTIRPPMKTKLRRGVAQLAYGQPGGGVEVIFVNGSPNKTVTGPAQIPP
jgi:hypothetical protein